MHLNCIAPLPLYLSESHILSESLSESLSVLRRSSTVRFCDKSALDCHVEPFSLGLNGADLFPVSVLSLPSPTQLPSPFLVVVVCGRLVVWSSGRLVVWSSGRRLVVWHLDARRGSSDRACLKNGHMVKKSQHGQKKPT